MQAEKPSPKALSRSLTLPEMILLVLAVSVCIYPAFAPFNASRSARGASNASAVQAVVQAR